MARVTAECPDGLSEALERQQSDEINWVSQTHPGCNRLTANHVPHSFHIALSVPHLLHVLTHSGSSFITSTENGVNSSNLQKARRVMAVSVPYLNMPTLRNIYHTPHL